MDRAQHVEGAQAICRRWCWGNTRALRQAKVVRSSGSLQSVPENKAYTWRSDGIALRKRPRARLSGGAVAGRRGLRGPQTELELQEPWSDEHGRDHLSSASRLPCRLGIASPFNRGDVGPERERDLPKVTTASKYGSHDLDPDYKRGPLGARSRGFL